ncbi:helix-turn-helix transcriptional regulator [Nonomuraea sp. NPDC046570]|uniref:helix-turn-helix domain-containing protein n=1 Tax=Nonomuraea sp. NPDC046570 TaxID=3155255 RepID=UPI0033E38236
MEQPFDHLLREAITARGLSLERLHARLSQRGIQVSLASLSNWQRGKCRPERSHSLRALHALEEILALPGDTLVASLGPPRPRGRWVGHIPGAVPFRDLCPVSGSLQRLLSEIKNTTDGQLALLSYHDHFTVGLERDERAVRTRAVFQARSDGVDRHVAIHYNERSRLPDDVSTAFCRTGRVRTDEAAGLTAVELLFDRPLAEGETYVVEYEFGYRRPGPESTFYNRWFRFPVHSYLLTLQFAPGRSPVRCFRVFQPTTATPSVDVGEIRLSGWNSAHIAGTDISPGVHGIRWEWA